VSIASLSSLGAFIGGTSPASASSSSLTGALLSAATSTASGNSANAAVVVALAGLQVVDDVIAAIRTADIASGKQFGAAGIPQNPVYQPREVFKANPKIEPGKVIHTPAKVVPGPVIYEKPHFRSAACEEASPAIADHRPVQTGPLPPWKILPWQQPEVCKVKIILVRPDTEIKGSLIDCFL
jgi:hypothetical protein